MSADLLREAAALMRERASAATQGPWVVQRGYARGVTDIWMPNDARGCYAVTAFGTKHRENGQHIVSWHPDVALAVADWLDVAAGYQDVHEQIRTERPDDPSVPESVPIIDAAVAVARAYLGRTS